VPTQVVTYQVDDSTKVMFEVEPVQGFHPAGAGQIAGRVRDAVTPAVDAARAVLDKVKEIGPDGVEVRFGVKVSGGADWLVARSAGEASFEITLTWSPKSRLGKAMAADADASSAPQSDSTADGAAPSGSDG
jgi:hypothetical protein